VALRQLLFHYLYLSNSNVCKYRTLVHKKGVLKTPREFLVFTCVKDTPFFTETVSSS
jgi:hypothetical protein